MTNRCRHPEIVPLKTTGVCGLCGALLFLRDPPPEEEPDEDDFDDEDPDDWEELWQDHGDPVGCV